MAEPGGRRSPMEQDGREAARTLDPSPACYREGEYWTLAYAGTVCRLRDARGLPCLAFLLRHPGESFAAIELLEITTEGRGPEPGPAARAVDAEEARVLVTKRIRGVIKKIQAHHPSLAHHLGTCIKTGARCAYLPDPERPLRWAT